jgi:hypothetical protein
VATKLLADRDLSASETLRTLAQKPDLVGLSGQTALREHANGRLLDAFSSEA